MRTIYKYPVEPGKTATVPANGKVVHAGYDPNGAPCCWVEHDVQHSQLLTRSVRIFGTGHPIPEGWTYGATFTDGPFIWHVYYMEGSKL